MHCEKIEFNFILYKSSILLSLISYILYLISYIAYFETMNFEVQLLDLVTQVFQSTHEAQVIEDVSAFIRDLLAAYNERRLKLTFRGYQLYTDLINEVAFKQYVNILDTFDTSGLRFHEQYSLRFNPEDVFKFGVNNNLMDVVLWAFKRCYPFQDLYLNRVFQPWINACSLGYLEIAQVLLKELQRRHFGKKIIEPNVLAGFEVACKYGKVNVVEWLLMLDFKYEYKPDIISTICDKHFINVLDVLIRYRPYKLQIVFNADRSRVVTYAIHSLQEEKWLQRKLPLLAHYYNNVTAFNCIPIEMVRHICEFV